MFTTITIAARTIPNPNVLSSYSSISSMFSNFPKFSLQRRPTSFISFVSNPTYTYTCFALSYSSIPIITTSFVSHKCISFPLLSTRQYSFSSAVWNPQRVSCFESLQPHDSTRTNAHHWLVYIHILGFEFDSEQAMFDFFIKSLATVVGSETEAMNKIYLVSVEYAYGFGVEIDRDTKDKLIATIRMQNLPVSVCKDLYYTTRKKDPNIQSSLRFTPVNWHRRLDNIFSYHHLSKRNLEWNFDYWLINTKEPDGGFTNEADIVDFYIKLLADVVESKNEAKERIYLIWLKMPFGFAAKVDGETSNKLKGIPGVLKVLPDYAFDVNKSESDYAITINPPSHGAAFSYYLHSEEESYFKAWNHRLNDVYSYHHLSKCNWEWSSDHWLVHIRQPDCEVRTDEKLTIEYCIQLLAKVVGSEKDAKEKIYMIWCKAPFGFGAEMDEKTSNKLKGLPDVLTVLPDYAFDIKNKDRGALVISPSSYLKPDSWYYPLLLTDIVDSDADEYDAN